VPSEETHSTVWSAGQVIVGAVVSAATVTTKEHIEELPEASVAVQVTVVVPSANTEPEGGEQTTLGVGSQASVAIAEKLTTSPPSLAQVTRMSAGQVIEGAVVSATTVTSKEHIEELPEASVAVQLTVVVPTANTEPEGGEQTTLGEGSQASVADTEKVTTAPPSLAHGTTMSAGQVIAGAVESATMVTSKEHIEELPEPSVAVQMTVVVPTANTEPEGGEQTTLGDGSQASVAEAVKEITSPASLAQVTTMSAGHVIAGAVVSATTLTSKEHIDELPEASVAVQVTVVVPTANTEPEGGEQTTLGAGSQASLAVAVKLTTAPPGPAQVTRTSPGQVTAGAVVSSTVTEKVHCEELPSSSVAVTVTTVVPSAKVLPEGGTERIAGVGSHQSVAVGVNVTTSPAGLVHSTVKSVGQVTAGWVVSSTVTSKVHCEELPEASVAVTVTVVVPSAKMLPDGGVDTMAGAGSQTSVAVGVKLTTAPAGLAHSAVTSAGHVTKGGSVSGALPHLARKLSPESMALPKLPPAKREIPLPSSNVVSAETMSVIPPPRFAQFEPSHFAIWLADTPPAAA